MTDIHQWRRMIQPARARTPAIDIIDDSDGVLSPATPRKVLKPKLSSYFTQSASTAGPSKALPSHYEILDSEFPTWSTSDLAPNPEVEGLIGSVMSRLLEDPYNCLDARFNGILLEIFECFRNINDDKTELQFSLQQEIERRSAVERAMHESAQQWDQERQAYRAEVKRLELVLAAGERGLAGVTLARQDSVIPHNRGNPLDSSSDQTLETVFEFLERTKRYEDKMWSSQRATMRRRPASPSVAMRRLSQTLTNKSIVSSVHYDLPFGTPVEMSLLERTRQNVETSPASRTTTELLHYAHGPQEDNRAREVSEARKSLSDDTLSTFSCAGDLLPDETRDVNLIEVAGTDNDFVAIKRIAQVLAKRRHIDQDKIMPKLQQLFGTQDVEPPLESERSSSLPGGLVIQLQRTACTATGPTLAEANFAKHPRLKRKASEFFSKWRPQLNIHTSTDGRRFSFEPGDDRVPASSAPPIDNLPAAVKDRLLRKSVSLSFLSEAAASREPQKRSELFPIPHSPTASVQTADCRKPSRIPTPVYNNGSLARPRQDREDSASSLLTAIKHADEVFQRTDSMSSSAFNSPCASRADFTLEGPGSCHTRETKYAINDALLEHTNTLRGNAFAPVAGETVCSITTDVDHRSSTFSAHGKRLRVLGSVNRTPSLMQSRSIPDMGEPRKENIEPMIASGRFVDHESNATL